jgi:hypothetical protein
VPPVSGALARLDSGIRRNDGFGNGGLPAYRSGQIMFEAVTPAKAGVQLDNTQKHWMPAFTGMTAISNFTWPGQ